MKKINAKKLNFNKKKFTIYFLSGFILLTTIVAGSTLVGLGFSNFLQFLDFKSYYATLRPDLVGFNTAWNLYNTTAATNGWTVANIEMFVIGTILLISFLILIVVFFGLFIFKKKNNKATSILNVSQTNVDIDNVDSNVKTKKIGKKKSK